MNSRSLHYATPDFLCSLVALANSMRLSLQKAAHAAVARSRVQEIRVRSGRDDKVASGRRRSLPNNVFIQNHSATKTTLLPKQLCHPNNYFIHNNSAPQTNLSS